MTPHPPELVERVAACLRALYDKHAGEGRRSTYHCDPVLGPQAEWVLDLAERAAREAQALADADRFDGATSMSEDAIKALAVRRAVEGA